MISWRSLGILKEKGGLDKCYRIPEHDGYYNCKDFKLVAWSITYCIQLLEVLSL